MKCCNLVPCENLRACFITRPPLVVFTIGLFLLGGCFVSLAFYVIDHDSIRDPNVNTDWNQFLENLQDYGWCTNATGSINEPTTPPENVDNSSSVSVMISVNMTVTRYRSLSDSPFYQAVVWRNDLTQGKDSHALTQHKDKLAKIGFSLLTKNFTVTNEEGTHIIVPVCMTMSASSAILPKQLKKPESCVPVPNPTEPKPTSGNTMEHRLASTRLYPCRTGVDTSNLLFRVHHDEDDSLEMFLTLDDRTNIHLHLLSTSYFLLMIALSLVLYGFIKRRNIPKSDSPIKA